MESAGGLIARQIENHEKRINTLEMRITLNEEKDSFRDAQIEKLSKELHQNTTSVNTMLDTLGGENGLISSVRTTEKNQNRSAGFLAFAGAVLLTLGGWGYSLLTSQADKMYEQARELATIKAKVE